ncbi:MAG: peptidylprolyl isomerase [Pirellulales bacterium]|nr:peptidylprolyl isomerase [Pirellulales bacterium]
MQSGCGEPTVANASGIAAFVTNHLEDAEKYLGLAAEKDFYKAVSDDDKLAQLGRAYFLSLSTYKNYWKREEALRLRQAESDNLPRVLLKTTKGDILLELFENEAPNTVANFISLVEAGFYDGLTFHRVMSGFMAQGGCPRGDGSGDPGYTIACECYKPNHRLHFRGSLSMAHRGRDTGGSQFFLTFVPTFQLNGKHTVFGRVIEGMNVLAKLQRRNPDDKEAPLPDKIIKAEVVRKRPHPYKPEKMPQ